MTTEDRLAKLEAWVHDAVTRDLVARINALESSLALTQDVLTLVLTIVKTLVKDSAEVQHLTADLAAASARLDTAIHNAP